MEKKEKDLRAKINKYQIELIGTKRHLTTLYGELEKLTTIHNITKDTLWSEIGTINNDVMNNWWFEGLEYKLLTLPVKEGPKVHYMGYHVWSNSRVQVLIGGIIVIVRTLFKDGELHFEATIIREGETSFKEESKLLMSLTSNVYRSLNVQYRNGLIYPLKQMERLMLS